MRLLTCCLALGFATVAFAAPVPKERAEADKVVGTWKLVKSTSKPDGLAVSLTMQLTADGKLVLEQTNSDGRTFTYEGDYRVAKNELPYSVKYPDGTVKKETLTIKKITETELIVVDPDGIQEDFERVKAKKEEKKP
jgi:uncharacterized protein (TIGR03066 family)